jgi:predicted MFS family arabinose efflux permease
MSAAGVVLAFVSAMPYVLAATFLGMINGMGRDRGAAQAIDQAVLAQTVTATSRTAAFARYTLVVDVGTAIGALVASAVSSRAGFLGYAGALGLTAILYAFMTRGVEPNEPPRKVVLSAESRRHVFAFAALSTMDSLGGGFITRALLTYWFVHRFDVDPGWVGPLFAAASLVNAVAYLVATWLSKRIGLVNTMVFTHIPSSLLLMLVPLAPNFAVAGVLFLLREFFAPMDVPTRQSYLASIVRDNERTAAAGIVNVARNASWVVGPSLAGWAMQVSQALPLFFAGAIKIVYDLALWRAFRHIKPPEESPRES